MPSKGRTFVQLVNKNGTPVEVTDDNKLKVEGTFVITPDITVRTPTLTRATGSGTIAAGARSVSFLNSGADDVPTVLGSVLKQGESISFNAGGEDDTLSAIAYTVASGELLIAAIY